MGIPMSAAEDTTVQNVYTTGAIARICCVAPRTVSKWFDAGKLRGYRIPGSLDRRVQHHDLVAFLRENDLEHLLPGVNVSVLLVGLDGALAGRLREALPVDGYEFRETSGAFGAGLAVAQHPPDAVVLDFSSGRADALRLASLMRSRKESEHALLLGVACEDEGEPDAVALANGFDRVWRQPFDVRAMAEYLAKARKPGGKPARGHIKKVSDPAGGPS